MTLAASDLPLPPFWFARVSTLARVPSPMRASVSLLVCPCSVSAVCLTAWYAVTY